MGAALRRAPTGRLHLGGDRPTVTGKIEGGWHEATAELVFLDAPREELADLGLRRAVQASAGVLGITVTGATAR